MAKKIFLFKVFTVLLLLSCTANTATVPNSTIQGKVIGIKDGDTIDILYNGKKLTIRLEHIDCPEKKQPYGAVAKKFISEKCFGQAVTIQHNNKYDRNKRLIGEVINFSGENLNKELVKAGLAWHYKQYSSDTIYANLEKEAKKNKTGLWAELNATPPWKWRNK
jgi:endonuclease YncB( thermonuclease family)